jgi:hypothetical protein
MMAQWMQLTGTDGHPTWVNMDRIAYMKELRNEGAFHHTLIHFDKEFTQQVKEPAEEIIAATRQLGHPLR